MNNEQNKEFDPGDLSSTVWEAMLAPAEGAAPSADTIDTPAFRRLMGATSAYTTYSEPYENAATALITHIMDWHSARMAAETKQLHDQLVAINDALDRPDLSGDALDCIKQLTRKIDDLLAERQRNVNALAAAREQALEEAIAACVEHYESSGLFHINNCTRILSDLKSTKPEAVAPVVQPSQPELTVWYGAMPESNGRSNFTATLMRKGASLFDTDSYTFARSEYPERVRYEADSMRCLIGELAERPCLMDYDADKHSGYIAPVAVANAPVAGLMEELRSARDFIQAFAVPEGTKGARESAHMARKQVESIDAILAAALAERPVVAGEGLTKVAEQLRKAGAMVPAPENKGTIESAMATGLSIALCLVEDVLATQAERQPQPAADVERDAARYRWLRNSGQITASVVGDNGKISMPHYVPSEDHLVALDKTLDAAIQQESLKGQSQQAGKGGADHG